MKTAKYTDSCVQCLTSNVSSIINAEKVLSLSNFYSKYQTPFSEELKDAKEREKAILVLNLAADDEESAINEWLCANFPEKIENALLAVKNACEATQIYIVETTSAKLEVKNEALSAITTHTLAPRSVVLRQESALYNFILTGEILSRPIEKDFISQGISSRPTLSFDAETLCRIYETCSVNFTESKLVVINCGTESQIAEIKTNTPVSAVLKEFSLESEKAVLLGGVNGKFIDGEEKETAVITTDSLFDSITVFSSKDCIADKTKRLSESVREQSCQKCVLCREGSWHFMSIFQDICAGKAKKEDLAMIEDIAPIIQEGAFCDFGKKMANLFLSAVKTSREELEAHFIKKKCPAGTCLSFSKPVIDPQKCTGCTDCADECEEDAILSKKGFIHIIDSDMCENCGKCISVCEENAIVMQDGTIKVPKKLVKVGRF